MPSRVIHVVAYCRISFLSLNNTPEYICVTFCLSLIYSPIDGHWVASTSWVLWIVLWIWMCKYLFMILLSILLEIYPEVGLLGHTVILCLIFWGNSIQFSIVVAPFYISNNSSQKFQFLHILINTRYFLFFFFFLIVAILMGVRYLLCLS